MGVRGRLRRWASPCAGRDHRAPGCGDGVGFAEFLEGCTSLSVRDLLASGATVSGLATMEWGARPREAAFIAELDSGATQILRSRWFWEDS